MNEQKMILIIEDDGDMVEAMKLMLEPAGHRLVTVDNPEQGFSMAKAKPPDLILLDVMFGSRQEAQGFDYAVKFRQDKSLATIPILMITSVNKRDVSFHFSPDTDEQYLPVDGFIDKPPEPEDLAEKVDTLLKKKISVWANWPVKSPPQ